MVREIPQKIRDDWHDEKDQSHIAFHLLPALPSRIDNGKVRGLRTRGAFEVDLSWKEGQLGTVTIRSLKGETCRLKYVHTEVEFEMKAGQLYNFDGSLRQL